MGGGQFLLHKKSHTVAQSYWRFHPCLKNLFSKTSLLSWYYSTCWKWCSSTSKHISHWCNKLCYAEFSSFLNNILNIYLWSFQSAWAFLINVLHQASVLIKITNSDPGNVMSIVLCWLFIRNISSFHRIHIECNVCKFVLLKIHFILHRRALNCHSCTAENECCLKSIWVFQFLHHLQHTLHHLSGHNEGHVVNNMDFHYPSGICSVNLYKHWDENMLHLSDAEGQL